MAAPAALVAAPLLEKGGHAVVQALNTPVIGTTWHETVHKKNRDIETQGTFNLRAWEIILGFGALWFISGAPLPGGKSFFSFDPFNLLGPNFDPLAFDPFHLLGGGGETTASNGQTESGRVPGVLEEMIHALLGTPPAGATIPGKPPGSGPTGKRPGPH